MRSTYIEGVGKQRKSKYNREGNLREIDIMEVRGRSAFQNRNCELMSEMERVVPYRTSKMINSRVVHTQPLFFFVYECVYVHV